MPQINTSFQMTDDELGKALKSLLPDPDSDTQMLAQLSYGATVVLCTEKGFSISLHEVLVRRMTNLLDAFDSVEELRDPFGSLVIVLQGVEIETLQALAQLLYAGECCIKSEKAKETLTNILASELLGSPEDAAEQQPFSQSAQDHQPQHEQGRNEGQDDNLQHDTMIDSSYPDVSEKNMGNNNTELQDLQNEDNETIALENAVEVLCSNTGSECLNSEENAENRIESERKTHSNDNDVETSETGSKVDISDQDSLMEKYKSPSKVYKCLHCDKRFSTHAMVERHERIHTGEKPFICSHCDKRFNTHGNCKRHESIHTEEKPFKCTKCDKSFSRSDDLKTHERTHTGEKPFKCSHCDKLYNSQRDVERHERIHTGEKPFKCSHCDKRFNTHGNRKCHERTHTGEMPFKCTKCDKSFSVSSHLKRHERTHTGEMSFKCTKCDRSFSQSNNLKIHERTHTGEKPFKCTECDKSFSDPGAFKRHERTHTGEKSFKCKKCDKSFSQPGNLKTHERTHTGEKPFKCSNCDKTFSTSSHLKRHVRTHTGEKTFKCSFCDKWFNDKGNREKHERIHK